MSETKYRSEFEKRLHLNTFPDWDYESCKITYTEPATLREYTPDFTRVIDGITVHIEAKGRFRTLDEARKYLYIRDGLSDNEKLVFVIGSKKTKMPRCKKLTIASWLEKNGFEYIVEGEKYNG